MVQRNYSIQYQISTMLTVGGRLLRVECAYSLQPKAINSISG